MEKKSRLVPNWNIYYKVMYLYCTNRKKVRIQFFYEPLSCAFTKRTTNMKLCRAPSQNARQSTTKLTTVRHPLPPNCSGRGGARGGYVRLVCRAFYWRRTKDCLCRAFFSNARQMLFVSCTFVCCAFYCLTHGKGGYLSCARGVAYGKHFCARQSCSFP
jgi:hypothetical protein